MAEVRVATVRSQVLLSLFTDFEGFTTFTPTESHESAVKRLLDEVVAWGTTLKPLRMSSTAA